jgi:hypothetical protein
MGLRDFIYINILNKCPKCGSKLEDVGFWNSIHGQRVICPLCDKVKDPNPEEWEQGG